MNRQILDRLAKISIRRKPFTADDRFPPSTYYRFLYELAKYKQAKLSVVLGVCGGGCCYNLSKADTGNVVGIEINETAFVEPHKYLKDNCNNFELIYGDSVKLAQTVYDTYHQKVDVLFVDTVHEYEQTLNEFKVWLPFLANDAVVCLDDLYRPTMMAAYDYLVDNYGEGYRNRLLHLGSSYIDGCFGCIFNIRKS